LSAILTCLQSIQEQLGLLTKAVNAQAAVLGKMSPYINAEKGVLAISGTGKVKGVSGESLVVEGAEVEFEVSESLFRLADPGLQGKLVEIIGAAQVKQVKELIEQRLKLEQEMEAASARVRELEAKWQTVEQDVSDQVKAGVLSQSRELCVAQKRAEDDRKAEMQMMRDMVERCEAALNKAEAEYFVQRNARGAKKRRGV
jgi:hypothetical protein